MSWLEKTYKSEWMNHVKSYAKKHNITRLQIALQGAAPSYCMFIKRKRLCSMHNQEKECLLYPGECVWDAEKACQGREVLSGGMRRCSMRGGAKDRYEKMERTSSYSKRKAPMYHATEYCGKFMQNDDGDWYYSKRMSKGCRWVKADCSTGECRVGKAKKRSTSLKSKKGPSRRSTRQSRSKSRRTTRKTSRKSSQKHSGGMPPLKETLKKLFSSKHQETKPKVSMEQAKQNQKKLLSQLEENDGMDFAALLKRGGAKDRYEKMERTSTYSKRKAPMYHATEYCGQFMQNDHGDWYYSKRMSKGCRWVKADCSTGDCRVGKAKKRRNSLKSSRKSRSKSLKRTRKSPRKSTRTTRKISRKTSRKHSGGMPPLKETFKNIFSSQPKKKQGSMDKLNQPQLSREEALRKEADLNDKLRDLGLM